MSSDKTSKPASSRRRRPGDAARANGEGVYEATTRGIRVRVAPEFDSERSEPAQDQFFWLYTVEIENVGKATVKLVSRHWRITDARGQVQEVKGQGVVGQQPTLAPGESFRYTSGCPLPTESGFMAGTYMMVSDTGTRFEAVIPTFSLDVPGQQRSMH